MKTLSLCLCLLGMTGFNFRAVPNMYEVLGVSEKWTMLK
jgi:hypothetical protein